MKHTKLFTFDTSIIDKYAKTPTTLGYARITGIGYWYSVNQADYDNGECNLEDIASFDIESVRLLVGGKEQDSTLAYRISNTMGDSFADRINEATLAHMGYVFTTNVENAGEIDDTAGDYERDEMNAIIRNNS